MRQRLWIFALALLASFAALAQQTPNLHLTIPPYHSYVNTWWQIVNNNFSLIDAWSATAVTNSNPGLQTMSGPLRATFFDATSGFKYNSAAPLNHCLVGNGTYYVDSASCGGVPTVNANAGPLVMSFSSGAGSCSYSGGTTICTFTGSGSGGGTVTNFILGSLPSWLSCTVATSTTTPTLSCTASGIPNSTLANSSVTLGSTSVALGSSISGASGFNAATATGLSTNGTGGQVWGMNSGGTAQGWQTISGGGGGTTTYALTLNNSGSGASSGTSFNGSAAVTLSYNTLGASPTAGSTGLTTLGTITTGTWHGTAIAAGYGGTGVANTATLTLGTANQNWASLGTGIVKNTTTTGAISDAASSDVIGLWSGTCSSSTYLRGDGSCQAPSGSGTVNSGTAGHLAYYAATGTAVSADSNLDDGATAANTLTYSGSGGISASPSASIGQVSPKPGLYSALPTCSTSTVGFAVITDSTTQTWGATASGTGTPATPYTAVFCDSNNWTVMAK